LIVHGLSNQSIGQRLSISEATVRTHVSNILSKLHLASRIQAALYALQQGELRWMTLIEKSYYNKSCRQATINVEKGTF
jgi:FixJ family two-component response regulator